MKQTIKFLFFAALLSIPRSPAWAAPSSLAINRSGSGAVELKFQEERFGRKFLEASTSLPFANTSVIPHEAGSASDPADQPARFFRLRTMLQESRDYCLKAGITSPEIQNAVDLWMLELSRSGLASNLLYMASFRPEQSRIGQSAIAMIGPDAAPNGPFTFRDGGLYFNGSFGLTVPDFARASSEEALSVFAVFASSPNTRGLLLGQVGQPGDLGPNLWAGGTPYFGTDYQNVFWNITENGFTNGEPGSRTARTFNLGNCNFPEIFLATASPVKVAVQANVDRQYVIGTSSHPVFLSGKSWFIGSPGYPDYTYHGVLYFLAVFNTEVSQTQYKGLFNAYLNTLGSGLAFPKTTIVLEGDSLSEESAEREYNHFLAQFPHWKGAYFKKNIATGGEGIAAMLAEFPTQALPLGPGENRLFLWAGRNDLPAGDAEYLTSRLREYWKRARQAGYKVAAFTIVPAAYEETQTAIAATRKQVNEFIRNSRDEYDWLIDVDSLPQLSNPKNLQFFLPDGVHLTATAGQLIASYIGSTVEPPLKPRMQPLARP
jgi:lysophospholipase L1-like esterase